MQSGRERIVDQLPMATLALERHAGDVQTALANVANGYGAVCATASRDSAENRRAGNRELPRRHFAGYCDASRAGGIVAEHRHRCGLGAKAGGREAYRRRQKVSRRDSQWIRHSFWNHELRRRGSDAGYREHALSAIVQDQRLILEGADANLSE